MCFVFFCSSHLDTTSISLWLLLLPSSFLVWPSHFAVYPDLCHVGFLTRTTLRRFKAYYGLTVFICVACFVLVTIVSCSWQIGGGSRRTGWETLIVFAPLWRVYACVMNLQLFRYVEYLCVVSFVTTSCFLLSIFYCCYCCVISQALALVIVTVFNKWNSHKKS